MPMCMSCCLSSVSRGKRSKKDKGKQLTALPLSTVKSQRTHFETVAFCCFGVSGVWAFEVRLMMGVTPFCHLSGPCQARSGNMYTSRGQRQGGINLDALQGAHAMSSLALGSVCISTLLRDEVDEREPIQKPFSCVESALSFGFAALFDVAGCGRLCNLPPSTSCQKTSLFSLFGL